MARTDNEVRITLSVLDRLVDYEPGITREAAATRTNTLRQLKQAIKRDLEWLLNTRQTAEDLPPDMKEINHSLAAYGLPDFSNASVKSPADRTRICRALENVISIFEPRLTEVVVVLEAEGEHQRDLHFRIDAQLDIEPAPEPVTFDTVLQLSSGQYAVEGE
ncbi:MAG: type VI secretion system baseplate subunit TssE [Pyrinomonadaceae bacterium]